MGDAVWPQRDGGDASDSDEGEYEAERWTPAFAALPRPDGARLRNRD
jgi:hypothetical protein